ncbi:MAG: hypothetical protein K8T91_10620 [Planctomycetes bacterium]|nr:hypothetical protein [Planctomycetota bacterium]
MPISYLEMGCKLCSLSLALALSLTASLASAAVLYDGSLSGAPAVQGWNYIADDPTPLFDTVQATHGETGGVTTLDTTPDIQDRAGYFSEIPFFGTLKHPLLGTLDRGGDGYTVRIRARVVSEDHSGSTHRAGLSLIVLSNDSVGLELAFPTLSTARPTSFSSATIRPVPGPKPRLRISKSWNKP